MSVSSSSLHRVQAVWESAGRKQNACRVGIGKGENDAYATLWHEMWKSPLSFDVELDREGVIAVCCSSCMDTKKASERFVWKERW